MQRQIQTLTIRYASPDSTMHTTIPRQNASIQSRARERGTGPFMMALKVRTCVRSIDTRLCLPARCVRMI
jgi:MarR-like DNA-binding transcriptional regulator SgrR of sgrS sRNA